MKTNMLRAIMSGPTIAIGDGTCQIWHSRSNYIAIGEKLMCMFSIVRCKSRVRFINGRRVSYRFDCRVIGEYTQAQISTFMRQVALTRKGAR